VKYKDWIISANIWVFSVLVFITFLILGFANGQLNDLRNKLMNDPFVLTIDVLHRGGELQNKTRELLLALANDPDSMRHYNISDISEYDREFLSFVDIRNPNRRTYHYGRSMRHDDPMLAKIIDKNINNAFGQPFNDPNDVGVIVTRDLLKDLGYDANTPVIYIWYYIPEEDTSYKAPLPVKAVVDHLPGREKNYFLYTPNFYDYYKNVDGNFPMQKKQNIKISMLFEGKDHSLFKNEFKSALTEELKNQIYRDQYGIRSSSIEVDSNNLSYRTIYDFIIMPRGGSRDFSVQNEFFESLMASSSVSNLIEKYDLTLGKSIYQSYYFELVQDMTADNDRKIGRPYIDDEKGYISFLFDKTDKIRDFARVFNEQTRMLDEERREGLAMDISKVESMHIFNKVSGLTNTILLFLIAFGIATISIFVYNMFNMHLHKIRKNIGTLMAFGINVKHVYRYVLFTFTFYCFSIPFVLSFFVGYLLIDAIFDVRFSFLTSSGFLAWTVWITIFSIFLGALIVYWIANRKYFKKTPSGLIFKS
jgi:hypothetical protein